MSEESAKSFQASFFSRNPLAESLIRLFDSLPDAYFYAKDRHSRYVWVNHLFLENHGLADEYEAIGKSDRDLQPPHLAEAYMNEDQRVMASGKTLPGQVWLVLHRRRIPRWYVSTKTPLFDATGKVIGVAGAMYRIQQQRLLAKYFQELLPAVQFMDEHYAEPISMKRLAQRVGLSSTHFNRRFRELLRMTPMQYLCAIRIQATRRLLATSSKGLAEISLAVGYADQSHLTKRFRQVMGMTPTAYRKRFLQ